MLRKTIIALAICLPLTACETMKGGSADQYSPAAIKQNLVIGTTTSEQVRSIYGTPESTQEGPNGPSLWVYEAGSSSTADAIQSAANMLGFGSAASQFSDERNLYIHFERNRVSSYSLSDQKPK